MSPLFSSKSKFHANSVNFIRMGVKLLFKQSPVSKYISFSSSVFSKNISLCSRDPVTSTLFQQDLRKYYTERFASTVVTFVLTKIILKFLLLYISFPSFIRNNLEEKILSLLPLFLNRKHCRYLNRVDQKFFATSFFFFFLIKLQNIRKK